MAENSTDCPIKDMEANKDDIAVAKQIEVKGIVDLDMNIDPVFRKELSDFLVKEFNRKGCQKHSFQPALAKIIPISNFKKDPTVCKELRRKFRQLLKKNSSNPQEKYMLHHETVYQLEKQRKKIGKTIKLNHQRGQLRKVWGNKEMPADKKILQYHARKDIFDMRSLNKSLPSKWNDNDIKNKAEKVSKKFLSIIKKKRRSFRKTEIIKRLYSYALELDNKLCISSKHQKCRSINLALKKVCGDTRNVFVVAFRPVTKREKSSNHNFINKEIDHSYLPKLPISHKKEMQDLVQHSKLQSGPSQNKKTYYTVGKEVIVFMKYQCAKEGKTRGNCQREKNENRPSLSAENLQNPEGIQFVSDQWDGEQLRNGSLQTQLYDSVSLSRQLSRLKITNS